MNGVPAVRHANKENTPEVVNATHQLQGMVGRNAKGNPAKFKPAMKRFHAQVSLINIQPFCRHSWIKLFPEELINI